MNLPPDLNIIRLNTDGSLHLLKLHHNCYSQALMLRSFDTSDPLERSYLDFVKRKINSWIDDLGRRSAKAQELKEPITTYSKFFRGSFRPHSPYKHSDSIYFLVRIASNIEDINDPIAVGFVRVGNRSLFLENQSQLVHVPECFSILDFYLSQQRQGLGYLLLSNVLVSSGISINQCAFDRPTPAMLSFLSKHFKLNQPRQQHNRYVIFDNFFQSAS